MPIIGALPNIIQNGQVIDAIPVMADLNYIISQVNANVPNLIPANATSIATFIPSTNVGGSGNAILLSPSPSITAYTAGQSFRFQATNQNTGAVTIQTSGLSPRSLVTTGGNPLTGSEILVGGIYDICDTGAAYQLVNGTEGSQLVTFSPQITFGGLAVGVVYGGQIGLAYKLGPIAFVWILLQLLNKGSSSGVLAISGFPYPLTAFMLGGGSIPFGTLAYKNVTFTGNDITAAMQPGNTYFNIFSNVSGSPQGLLNDTNCANTSTFYLSGYYPV